MQTSEHMPQPPSSEKWLITLQRHVFTPPHLLLHPQKHLSPKNRALYITSLALTDNSLILMQLCCVDILQSLPSPPTYPPSFSEFLTLHLQFFLPGLGSVHAACVYVFCQPVKSFSLSPSFARFTIQPTCRYSHLLSLRIYHAHYRLFLGSIALASSVLSFFVAHLPPVFNPTRTSLMPRDTDRKTTSANYAPIAVILSR